MFWIVQAGAVAFTLVCLFLLRKYGRPLPAGRREDRTAVTGYLPSFLLVAMIVLLIAASFVPDKPALTNGYICTGVFIAGLLVSSLRARSKAAFLRALKEIDYSTLLLLAGLFIVVAGITEAGLVEEIGKLFVRFSGDDIFLLYTLIVCVSVMFSAFVDNIPYVATMLPVLSSVAAILRIDPTILYFGLLSGATLGGNFTPIGASANITALGILRKNGYEVKTRQYMKISVPATFAAVAAGYVLIWLIWGGPQ